MIEINLLPEDLRKKERVRIALPEIAIKKTVYAVGAAVIVIQVLLTLAAFYSRLELSHLEKKAAALREGNREIVRQKAETTGVYNRLKEMRALGARKFYWASLLDAVAQTTTKGVWLRHLHVTEVQEAAAPAAKEEKGEGKSGKRPERPAPPKMQKYLVMEGSVMGAGQETAFIGKYLKELKNNEFFKQLFSDIKPSNISQKRLGEIDVYEFTISCQFKKDKAP